MCSDTKANGLIFWSWTPIFLLDMYKFLQWYHQLRLIFPKNETKERPANSCSIFRSCRCPETWMYQSGLKLVWWLGLHATTATAVFLWDYELIAMQQYHLSDDLLPNLQFCLDVPEKVWGWVFKYCVKSCPLMILWNLFDQSLSNCKIEELSGLQKTVLHCFVSGKDTFACLPTGYGKWLYMVNTFHLNNAKRELQSSSSWNKQFIISHLKRICSFAFAFYSILWCA